VDAIAAIDPIEGHVARAQYDVVALKKPDLADNEYHQAFRGQAQRTSIAFLAAADFYEKQNRRRGPRQRHRRCREGGRPPIRGWPSIAAYSASWPPRSSRRPSST
jgi:hypothetical protein